MDDIQKFLRQAKSRSSENMESFALLYANGKFGTCISILRMELDTLVRLVYLSFHCPPAEAVRLMTQSVNGEKWSRLNANGKIIKVTDKEMVDLATTIGWERIIYDFGSKLIHLSDYHAYGTDDPVVKLPAATRNQMGQYLSHYHGWSGSQLTFSDIIRHLPDVMTKLTDNVKCHAEMLETKLYS